MHVHRVWESWMHRSLGAVSVLKGLLLLIQADMVSLSIEHLHDLPLHHRAE